MLLRKFCGIEKTDNGYLIHGDAGDIKLVFMTDDIIRIRVSFDRKFKEASYALVTTAWEDELDELFQEERTQIQAKDVVCEEKERCADISYNCIETCYEKAADSVSFV